MPKVTKARHVFEIPFGLFLRDRLPSDLVVIRWAARSPGEPLPEWWIVEKGHSLRHIPILGELSPHPSGLSSDIPRGAVARLVGERLLVYSTKWLEQFRQISEEYEKHNPEKGITLIVMELDAKA